MNFYSRFFELKKDLIYAINLRAGFSVLDADEFGMTERYYLGGSNTVRGFEYRGIAPKDRGDDDVAIGGATRIIMNNELRFPIYERLKGLVFIDTGILDKEAFDLGTPRVGAGFGFRFDIPNDVIPYRAGLHWNPCHWSRLHL